jgi:hypothetical protein
MPRAQRRPAGRIASPRLVEASGLVVSRKNPGVLWAINDSGDGPNLYALDHQGRDLGAYELIGAAARDWEGLALADDVLYVGDIGDNFSNRRSIEVYRAVEPEVAREQASTTRRIEGVEVLRLHYPDTSHDAEALLVDAERRRLFVITKQKGRADLYAAPLDSSTATLAHVARLAMADLPPSTRVTAADRAPRGHIVLRTYQHGLLYTAPHEGAAVVATLAVRPCLLPIEHEPQGESIAAFDRGYFTVSEGEHQPLYRFEW